VIGPPLGGVLLEFFWWGSVFLLAVPVMLVLLVLGPVLLPECRDPEERRFDLLGAVLSLAAVLAVIYGLKQGVQDGFGWSQAAYIAGGLGIAVLFVQRQRRAADPLVDPRLFRLPAFSVSLVTYLLATFVAFAAFLFIFQYLQLVLGKSPLIAALWAVPSFAAFIVGSMLTPPIVRRVRPAYVMGGGLGLAATGYALLAQVDGNSPLALVVAASVVFSLGEAPVFTLATDLVVGTAPSKRAGTAAAISETSSELGGALGIAILGTIGAAVYRSEVVVPAAVPSEGAEDARDTLGGAVATSGELPDALAAELLDNAREAFTNGLQVAALTSAVIAAATAVVVAVVLRHVPVASAHEMEVGQASVEAEAGA
jgi:DHA2 family multidrug resistance protein-like MFS transporter